MRLKFDQSATLTISQRILLFVLIVCSAILVMAVAVYAAYRNFDYYSERSSWSNAQLNKYVELSSLANRHSEQLAELLLLGPQERGDFERSRWAFEDSLNDLDRLTRGEQQFISGRPDTGGDTVAAARFARIRAIYTETNEEMERLLELREAGRQEEAVQRFEQSIERRLDAELGQLLALAVEDEVAEVEVADEQLDRTIRDLTVLIAAALFGALTVSIAFGYLLYRSLARPIHKLSEAAIALGRGDLTHRIGHLGNDELGLLAARFDETAGQLLAARSDLEEQVRQRTAELREAHDRLQALYRSRVQLLADVSHELRTPITVLRGEAEVTLRGEVLSPDVARDTLRRILDKASEMSRLVDDILFLARTETDTVRFERGHADLLEIAAEAVREAGMLGRNDGVTIEAALPEAPLFIEGDRHRLKQALLIVFDNAIKYSDENTPVSFELALHERHAVMTILNHSSAVLTEDIPFLFERFYRGRNQKLAEARGSGLGLPIARFIVEKHGGSIRLTGDEASRRIAVSIRLPVAQVDRPAAQRHEARQHRRERDPELSSKDFSVGERVHDATAAG